MDLKGFESRKADHLQLSLSPAMEAKGGNGLEHIHLSHDALPELDFSQVQIATKFWSYAAASPFFISSMTAGHHQGESINFTLAKVAAQKKWPMGLGSQRRELSDPQAGQEWKRLRKAAPGAYLMGNLGLAQLVHTPMDQVLKLIDNLEAAALFIHLNPLQEALQPEGTPHFAGGLKTLEKLCKSTKVPVILKETGCGISSSSAQKIKKLKIKALDVSGFGGTHWGRIEGGRAPQDSLQQKGALTFAEWGESTAHSLLACKGLKGMELWASGGIRSGLEGAKCIALGAQKVGFAKPALQAALEGEAALGRWMEQIEFELKVALFCTGSKSPDVLRKGKKWQKI